ncbi:MAG TPA: DUF190 domain-containing protein [Candidatus Sulfotelmatobacter sp.]|nr:DUF190 domain-containing protein [Candidatus Sulfotelmatobacter sp.]
MIAHNAVLMRIYVSESARTGKRSTTQALVERLLEHGFRGATVFRGIEGFGSHRRLSVDWNPDAPGDLPMLIEVATDDIERLRGFLSTIDEVLTDGLVTLERIQRLICKSGGT